MIRRGDRWRLRDRLFWRSRPDRPIGARHRPWIAAAVLAFLATVTSIDAASANEASQKLVAEAEQLMKAAPPNRQQILQKLDAAVRADPRDGRAAFLHGAQLMLMHAARSGLVSLNKASAIDPARRNLQFFRGRALYDLGRGKEALAAYDRESNKDGNPMFSFYRGLANKQLKNYAAALADFDRSDAVYEAGRQGAQLHRGDIHAAQGKRVEAAKAYQAAVHADARSPVADTARARLAKVRPTPAPGAQPAAAAVPVPATNPAPTVQAADAPARPAGADCAGAETHWKSAEEIKTFVVYQDHLARFPNCAFATLARARIEALKR